MRDYDDGDYCGYREALAFARDQIVIKIVSSLFVMSSESPAKRSLQFPEGQGLRIRMLEFVVGKRSRRLRQTYDNQCCFATAAFHWYCTDTVKGFVVVRLV